METKTDQCLKLRTILDRWWRPDSEQFGGRPNNYTKFDGHDKCIMEAGALHRKQITVYPHSQSLNQYQFLWNMA